MECGGLTPLCLPRALRSASAFAGAEVAISAACARHVSSRPPAFNLTASAVAV